MAVQPLIFGIVLHLEAMSTINSGYFSASTSRGIPGLFSPCYGGAPDDAAASRFGTKAFRGFFELDDLQEGLWADKLIVADSNEARRWGEAREVHE